jgi:hypothetical protein
MGTIRCPACTAPLATTPGNKMLDCLYCGRQFAIQGELCPVCGHINPERAERCSRCSEPLSLIDQVFRRQEVTAPPPWLKRVRDQAGDIRQYESAASSRRMLAFEDRENARRSLLAHQMTENRLRDKRLLAAAIVGALAIILTVLALAALLR